MKTGRLFKVGVFFLLFFPVVEGFHFLSFFVGPFNPFWLDLVFFSTYLDVEVLLDFAGSFARYACLAGFTLVVFHYYHAAGSEEAVYRRLDRTWVLLLALTLGLPFVDLLVTYFMMEGPKHYVGFAEIVFWGRACITGLFTLVWMYSLFRARKGLALFSSLLCFALISIPHMSTNNPELVKEMMAGETVNITEEERIINEEKEVSSSALMLKPDEDKSISKDQEVIVASNTHVTWHIWPQRFVSVLLLAYTWMRWGNSFKRGGAASTIAQGADMDARKRLRAYERGEFILVAFFPFLFCFGIIINLVQFQTSFLTYNMVGLLEALLILTLAVGTAMVYSGIREASPDRKKKTDRRLGILLSAFLAISVIGLVNRILRLVMSHIITNDINFFHTSNNGYSTFEILLYALLALLPILFWFYGTRKSQATYAVAGAVLYTLLLTPGVHFSYSFVDYMLEQNPAASYSYEAPSGDTQDSTLTDETLPASENAALNKEQSPSVQKICLPLGKDKVPFIPLQSSLKYCFAALMLLTILRWSGAVVSEGEQVNLIPLSYQEDCCRPQ